MVDNIVVVVLDALRADRVGVYEEGRSLTPHIDRLTDDATVFTNAYSTTNATDPAITSLHTGRYPLTHGVVHHGTHVTDDEKAAIESTPLLPERLQEQGFKTVKSGRPLGRWHKRGFDEYPDVSTGHWRRKAIEKTISKLLYDLHPSIGDLVSRTYNTLIGNEDSDTETPDTFVEDLFPALTDSTPCYGFVHCMDTHTPYSAPDDLVKECLEAYEYDTTPLETIADEFPDGSVTANSLRPGGVVYEGSEPWVDAGYRADRRLIEARYDAAVKYADRKVGALVAALKEHDLYDETMLVVLADHGESLGEHGIYYEHHGLYEPTVSIPLIVRVPGDQPDRVDELVQLTDIAPTILDYTGIDGESSMDGYSLRPVLEADGSLDRAYLVAEEANTQRRRMLLHDDWKYITALDDGVCRYCELRHAPDEELYDLNADPAEQDNLAAEHPDRIADLNAELESRVAAFDNPTADGDQAIQYEDEAEIEDRLEALGYR